MSDDLILQEDFNVNKNAPIWDSVALYLDLIVKMAARMVAGMMKTIEENDEVEPSEDSSDSGDEVVGIGS